MAGRKQLRERTYLTATQPAQINKQPEASVVEQPSESLVAGKPQGIAGSAHKINNAPNSVARQQIFRQMATQYGNSYASKVATVMRDSAKPAAAPDDLDKLLGLSEHRSHYNDQQLQQARQLAQAESDQAKRTKLFKLLQTKVTYYNQNKNESKAFNVKTHQTWNLGIGMCNVTSLAMALEGIGVTLSQAKSTFPDTYEKYKAVIMAEEELSMEDRQKWVAATSEATRFPDFLEQLRLVNHLGRLTIADTWRGLSNLLGVNLEFITAQAGQHSKQWWLDNVQTAFEAGNSVVLGVDNHIIRLQEINEQGLVLDDPNGSTNLSKGMTTRTGIKIDFTWDSYQTNGDTLVPWDVAEKYNFRWVYKLQGAGATPGRAAAKKPVQTAQAPATPKATPKAVSSAAQSVLNQDQQQKALVAMKQAAASGASANKIVDQGYFAVRGAGKIDPANKQAVAEWLFIKTNLLRAVTTTPATQNKSKSAEQGNLIGDLINDTIESVPAIWGAIRTAGEAKLKQSKQTAPSSKTHAKSDVGSDAPAWRAGPLTDEMVNAIAAARAAVPEAKSGRGGLNRTTYAGNKNAGMVYMPSQSSEEKTFSKNKSGKQSDGTTQTAQDIIWEELASEGTSNSINTYDGQGMTWGRGFAAGGLLPDMLWRFFVEVPGSRAQFNSIGIDSDGSRIYTVDINAKKVVTGNSGLHALRHDRKISSFFINIGETHPQALVEAQFATVTKHRSGAANVPEWALNLPREYLQFIAHASHWYSGAFAWSKWRGHTDSWSSMLHRYIKLLPGRHMYRTKASASGIVHEGQAIHYALGNLSDHNKSWQTLTEQTLEPAITVQDTEILPSGDYFKVGKTSYRRIKS